MSALDRMPAAADAGAGDAENPYTWVIIGVGVAIALVIVAVKAWRDGRRLRAQRLSVVAEQAAELAEHHRPRWSADAASFGSRPEHWAIAIGAPFALCRGADQDRLAFRDAADEREILAEAWGVVDRASMLETLHDLLLAGHRERFAVEMARWAQLDAAEADASEKALRAGARSSDDGAERLWRFRRVRANDRGIRSVDLLAWDFVRFAMLVRAGATTGYLSTAEAVDLLLMIVPDVREHYGSWAELGESFRLGRWYWNAQGGEGERQTDQHDISRQQALMSEASPWSRLDWNADIPAARMLFADALRDEFGMPSMDPAEMADAPIWARRINDALRSIDGI